MSSLGEHSTYRAGFLQAPIKARPGICVKEIPYILYLFADKVIMIKYKKIV